MRGGRSDKQNSPDRDRLVSEHGFSRAINSRSEEPALSLSKGRSERQENWRFFVDPRLIPRSPPADTPPPAQSKTSFAPPAPQSFSITFGLRHSITRKIEQKCR
jgi:hypothetical protein